MTNEEQQIALSEWAGWKNLLQHEGGEMWQTPDGKPALYLPNTDSLDVLHEMVQKLTDAQAMEFCFALQRVCCGGLSLITGPLVVNATSAQRREALLRTIGKWKE